MKKHYLHYITTALTTLLLSANSFAQTVPCSGPINPGSDGCSDGDMIDTLVLVGENGTAFYDYATGCVGASAYDDRTTLPAVDLQVGSTYNAMISTQYFIGDFAAVWIDLNGDNAFDGSERITAMTTDLSTYTTPVPVNIPTNASVGLHKIRFMVGYPNFFDATYFEACNGNVEWDYGEVHDYMINIIASPTAITLGNLSVKNAGAENILNWNTLNEERTDKFEIERSADGKRFTKIAGQQANGTASIYSYTDKSPIQGVNHYRLKMIDAAEHSAYSKVVTATVTEKGNLIIETHPNPAKDILHVKLYNVEAVAGILAVYDVTGKLMLQQQLSSTEANIHIGSLTGGMYLLKYMNNNITQTVKFTKE